MATAKDIKKRIRSVTSTHKITRTMEMVATSKFKRAVARVKEARPFSDTLPSLLAVLADDEEECRHPLLTPRGAVRRVALLLLTTNRGLCGALNTSLIRLAGDFVAEQEEWGRETDLHVVGRKGVGFFRFVGQETASAYTELSDRPGPADAQRFADQMQAEFLSERVDEVHVAFPRFKNAAEHPATVERVLPLNITREEEERSGTVKHYLFEPGPDRMLADLLPLSLRNIFLRYLLEMAASEQGARRTAMKAATDSAREMIDSLTLSYNKARQAQITTELLEVVSGAEALR
ncbi:MAG: ATP synthase F1 subunit gamma [Candidatus Krumholzibacteriota bacterium]|nr:ATP synthase F1 subunit gamma [Candidatus Krumholzibacteriota bacterium]